ncbi:nitrogenase cofactor biosynthesis protein NifB [Paenibacillus sonchi]|uniref:FeMo cofactor biosynthesis protein NifB n=1 Tax=Paenibacillus sonchi TaxID=373687 RepID=A0A974SDA8_9BACL|nr:nitrogenase cofactor biosynthesis protein NifB [Paenibacillus sonchi]MCE3202913.1 nitrogenase cofactor biosynthesis protein NifB [Paenibacillus sonchi]QQZ61677.1 nitrogenase cofactor biosynthesis protein NifB [Paenibacillus sonchi]
MMQPSPCISSEAEEEISRHPCYSEEAHRFYARMHIPVAPACNIQCHYCNRKFDCVNESRPGVVSEVLTPEQAERKVKGVAAQLMQLSVVGIAGPGDPLANPEQTFDTFARVKKNVPDVSLCLSTNGLTLYRHIDEIVELGIRHVTITINAIDADVGQAIYPWVFDEGVRYEGKAAAELLISRQLRGLELLAKLGILVKVNSIMIPGVNDHHLPAVSKRVKELGATLHNVTPLIIAPGSQYEKDGRKAPRPKELHNLQELLGQGGMKVMRHCRQCRADAIGLLGQDRNRDFPLEAMEADPVINTEARALFQGELDVKIRERVQAKEARLLRENAPKIRVAVATRGGDKVNQHFGHATEFLVYDTDGAEVQLLGVRKIQAYCHGTADCNGDKAATLQEIISIVSDCRILLCSGIGDSPRASLNKAGVLPLVRKGGIQEAILESVKYSSYFENINISKG